MTPIEQICRALCIADGLDPDRKYKSSDWGQGTAPHEYAWHEYQPRARVVLLAIRDPSEAMTVDALDYEAQDSRATSRNIWQAMIDAALAERPSPTATL